MIPERVSTCYESSVDTRRGSGAIDSDAKKVYMTYLNIPIVSTKIICLLAELQGNDLVHLVNLQSGECESRVRPDTFRWQMLSLLGNIVTSKIDKDILLFLSALRCRGVVP